MGLAPCLNHTQKGTIHVQEDICLLTNTKHLWSKKHMVGNLFSVNTYLTQNWSFVILVVHTELTFRKAAVTLYLQKETRAAI